MSYFNNIGVSFVDGPNNDAFQRLRISDPLTIFDSKQLYGDNVLVWATQVTGNATSSFIANNASMALIASGSNTGVIRQTRKRFVYQPGKSQFIVCTGNFSGSSAGSIKRMGYYDQNNGMFFMSSGSSFGLVLRSNTSGTPVDTFYSQSSWNLDTYDGNGPSGYKYQITNSQIHFVDFEWLGVGRIRYGIFQGGIPTYVHQITNINALDSVYMSTPNLPIRYEIQNSGSTPASMKHICSTVVSEGGLAQNGYIRAASHTSSSALTQSSYTGLLAIRLSASAFDAGVVPLDIAAAQLGANSLYEVNIQVNPSGSFPWIWQNLQNSVIQFATCSLTVPASYQVVAEGTKVYTTLNAGAGVAANVTLDPNFALGTDITGSQDTLVVCWKQIAGTSLSASVAMDWREL